MQPSNSSTILKEDVFIVQWEKLLLMGQPTIWTLGLITDIPGAYIIRAVKPKCPILETNEDIRTYPKLFTGLGKLKGECTISHWEYPKPFPLYTPHRVPLLLMGKVQDELKKMVDVDLNL